MTSAAVGKVRLIITWFLRVPVGLIFAGIGVEKLTGTMGTIPFFDAIGWGQWFRYASGALDLPGALLIFVISTSNLNLRFPLDIQVTTIST